MAVCRPSRFLKRYQRLCEDMGGLEPLSGVVSACQTNQLALDLSGVYLCHQTCSVLARAIQKGHPFSELILADCLTGDEGMVELLNVLSADNHVTVLNLKGNNLHSCGPSLKKLLRDNSTIKRLCLGWNSLGTNDRSLSIMVDGLATNQSLTSLDLSSNHLSHHGITLLASALLNNSSITQLDLRWNNAGVLGGQALLSAVEQNSSSSLSSVELLGNSIPQDTVTAIKALVQLRAEQLTMDERYHSQHELMTSKLIHLQHTADTKMSQLNEEMEDVRETCIDLTKQAQDEINELKCELSMRHSEIAVLEERLATTIASKEMSESVCEGLRHSHTHLQEQYTTALDHFETALKEKDEVIAECRKAEQDNTERHCKTSTDMNNKIQLLEHDKELLVQKVALLQQEMKEKTEQNETKYHSLLGELESVKSSEDARLQRASEQHSKLLSEAEQSWNHERALLLKRVAVADGRITELLQEVQECSHRASSERIEASRSLDSLQHNMTQQQSKREGVVKEQITSLQQQLDQSKQSVSELQQQVRSLSADKSNLETELAQRTAQWRLACKTLDEERDEIAVTSVRHAKVKEQLMSQLDSTELAMRTLQSTLEEEKARTQEVKRQCSDETRSLQAECSKLRETLAAQTMMVEKAREEQAKRTLHLKAALEQYITNSS